MKIEKMRRKYCMDHQIKVFYAHTYKLYILYVHKLVSATCSFKHYALFIF